MNKFIIKTIPFVLLVICISVIRQYAGMTLVDKRMQTQVDVKTIDSGIVIMGDSRSQFGFMDTILTSQSDKKIYNLSSWACRPQNSIDITKIISIKNSVVFLNVSTRIFVEEGDKRPDLNIRFYNFNLLDELKNNYFSHDKEGKWEYEKQSCGSLLFKNKFKNYYPYSPKNDSAHFFECVNKKEIEKTTNTKTQHLLILSHILKLNHNKVIFINLPERQAYYHWTSEYRTKLYSKIKELTKQEVTDFGVYSDSLFYDSHHLNYIGVGLFTNEFANKFKKELLGK